MGETFHTTALAAVNEALVRIGEDYALTVLASDAGKDVANASVSRKAARVYNAARKRVLAEYPWSFNNRELAVSPVERDDGKYAVDLPGDCLVLVSATLENGERPPHMVVGSQIVCALPITTVIYSADAEDLDTWPAPVRDLLVRRLAAELAKPVSGRVSDLQLQEQQYQIALENAKLWDARQSNPGRLPYGRNTIADIMLGAKPSETEEAY